MIRAERFLALGALLLAANVCAENALADRIRQASADVRDLEALYRAVPDVGTRISALEIIMQRTAWLEQVGGMKDAVADQRLALARLEGFEQAAPLRNGYLAEADGTLIGEAQVRRPRGGELPERLVPFSKRILLLNVKNTSAEPLDLAGLQFETRRFGETKKEDPGKLPAEFQDLASYFALPERLTPGEERPCMLLSGDSGDAVTAVSVSLRQAGQDAARSLRVLFPEAFDPDAMSDARKKAAAIEKEILTKREAESKEAGVRKLQEDANGAKDPAPKPEEKKDAQEANAIGTVERAGSGALIQIRLAPGKSFQPQEILRVRKNGKWVGKIRVPEGVTMTEQKDVYWMAIEDGDRETLTGGTLHSKE